MASPNQIDPDRALLDGSTHFSLDSTIKMLGDNLLAGEKSLQDAMVQLQRSKNPDPASLAAMQFRINKWTLSFNLFSSMIKSVKDVASATIQKI